MTPEEIAKRLGSRRQHASFFEGLGDRRLKECGVVRALSEGLQACGLPGLLDIDSCEVDPPDCVARSASGELVGVEVTELVDQFGAKENRSSLRWWPVWDPPSVIERIEALVARKVRSCERVRSEFDRMVLCIHTDEFGLLGYTGDAVWDRVRKHSLSAQATFDDVFILVSFDPRISTYPVISLSGASREAG